MYREHWSSSSSQFYINTDAIVYTHIGSSFVRQGSIIELLYISFLTTSWGISNREFFLSTADFFNLPEKKKDIFNCPFYETFSSRLSQAPSWPWLSSTEPDFTFCWRSFCAPKGLTGRLHLRGGTGNYSLIELLSYLDTRHGCLLLLLS